jgi:hypothetical protein
MTRQIKDKKIRVENHYFFIKQKLHEITKKQCYMKPFCNIFLTNKKMFFHKNGLAEAE